jgi:hypothetical protein
VAGATVGTNINGVDVAYGNSKTDAKGKVFWMWPNQGISAPAPSETYSGWVWAKKGKQGYARETFLFHKAKHHDILLTLSREAATPGLAADRYKSRVIHPINERSAGELLDDLKWLEGQVTAFLNRATSKLDLLTPGMQPLKPFRDQVYSLGEKLGLGIKASSSAGTLSDWFDTRWEHRRNLGRSRRMAQVFDAGWINKDGSLSKLAVVSLAWSVVTSGYEIRAAIERNDTYALVKALGLFAADLFGEFHPLGAPAFIAVKLLYGYYEATQPKNLTGYLLQRAVPELAAVTNCNLYNERRHQFRIDMTASPWSCKSLTEYADLGMGADGFAWHQGHLVYLVGSTIRPVLVQTQKEAEEFHELLQQLEYVQSGTRIQPK